MAAAPRIGVAFGGGGARGLAHICYIEALDEMGLAPTVIAGTSIGALFGGGRASGLTGAELREHALRLLTSFRETAGRLWMTGRPTIKDVMENGISIQVDARNLTEAFLPDGFPDDFAALGIPLSVVATDFYAWKSVVFREGALRPAIAASLAIPGLLRPVRIDQQLFIDGGATNPLPIDLVRAQSDIVIGINVNGQPELTPEAPEPSPFDVGLVATQIMTESIVRNALALHAPEIYVHAPVSGIRTLEFWRVREVLEQADQAKDEFKRSVEARMKAFTKGLPQ